jgi:hypothetical protein
VKLALLFCKVQETEELNNSLFSLKKKKRERRI